MTNELVIYPDNENDRIGSYSLPSQAIANVTPSESLILSAPIRCNYCLCQVGHLHQTGTDCRKPKSEL